MKQTTLFDFKIQKPENKPTLINNYLKSPTEHKLKKILYKPSPVDKDFIDGFDASKSNWIYPINYPIRDYQLQIVQECLYKNTLVCLPTGLGKTFIASVVMYNFYLWYPHGKLIFVAPTRPLVNQQLYACQETVPIDSSDVIELTGTINQDLRVNLWKEKRIFFLTAQVLVNDLISNICPGQSIVFLVLDEAHKASKNHAYCQIIRQLTGPHFNNRLFRVLGLSATPGNELATIQDVIQNLLISHIELRTDECKDIKMYSHERLVEEIIVPLGNDVVDIRDRLITICCPILNRLKAAGAIRGTGSNQHGYSKFGLLKMKEEYRMTAGGGGFKSSYSVMTDFSQAISLYYAIELVQQHGIKSTFLYLSNAISNSQANPQILDLMQNPEFMEFFELIQQRVNSESFTFSHPKLRKLHAIVKEHFDNKTEEIRKKSRVIIFSQIRDSVGEIMELLKSSEPLIRPIAFMGRSKNVSQKEQMEAMRSFIEGTANVLVSTCIGEEGLDIGEVDLIICFDSQKSPIRLVQRAGRTGRKKEGRVVMLLSEGKEVNNYRTSLSKKSRIHSAIFEGYKHLVFYPDNPRMVPLGFDPIVSFEKVVISKVPKKSLITKTRKSLKQKDIIECMGNITPKSKFQTDIELFDSMRFLNEPTVARGETFTQRYRCNRHKNSLYQLQTTNNIGHSELTVNLISILKLKEMHIRGKTNMIFHLSNMRMLDLAEPMTQIDEETSQHSSKSFSVSLSSSSSSPSSPNKYDSKNNFTINERLIKLGNSVIISPFMEPIQPTLSNKIFDSFLEKLESSKPDLISFLDQKIKQVDLKCKIENSEISEKKLFINQFEENDQKTLNKSSPAKDLKSTFAFCTSTPISLNARQSNLSNILTSFNISKTTVNSPINQSLLRSFKLPTKSIPSIKEEDQLGMETALNFFDEKSDLRCELSYDLFSDFEDSSQKTQSNAIDSQLLQQKIDSDSVIIISSDESASSIETDTVDKDNSAPVKLSTTNLFMEKTNNNLPTSNIDLESDFKSDEDLFSDDFELYSPVSDSNSLSPKPIRDANKNGTDNYPIQWNRESSIVNRQLSTPSQTDQNLIETQLDTDGKNENENCPNQWDSDLSDSFLVAIEPNPHCRSSKPSPTDQNLIETQLDTDYESENENYPNKWKHCDLSNSFLVATNPNHNPTINQPSTSTQNLYLTKKNKNDRSNCKNENCPNQWDSDLSDSFLVAIEPNPYCQSSTPFPSDQNLIETQLDTDYERENEKENKSKSPSFESSISLENETQENNNQRESKRKPNPVREFFFSQAEVKKGKRNKSSEEDSDEDEEGDLNDSKHQLISSFINDNDTSGIISNTQMHQIYLQSIKSPPTRKNFHEIQSNPKSSIYSQPFLSGDDDDDDYLLDSFVIPDDYKTPKKKKPNRLKRQKDSPDTPQRKFKRLKSINDTH